ncbi:TetR/AcrR family transcriptional regulator [Streptomyces hiroshimensis]
MLFRRNGYSGTGLKRIAAEADAPFGSIYHFFPGGKQRRYSTNRSTPPPSGSVAG